MSIETRSFDPARYIEGKEGIAAYLDEAFATGDPAFVADALGVIARAAGLKELAERASLPVESVARALDAASDSDLKTIMKLLAALGLHLTVSAASGWQGADERETESSTTN